MRNALAMVMWGLAAVPAAADGALHGAFDAGRLTPQDVRFLETALIATGDLREAADAAWTRTSDGALAAYAERAFADTPRPIHAASLAIGLLARLDAEGWATRAPPGLDLALALPEAILDPAVPEDGGLRRWSRDGRFTVLTHSFDAAGAERWHGAAARTDDGSATLEAYSDDTLRVTRGRLADGRGFYTRSERRGATWPTVFFAADPEAQARLDLATFLSGGAAPAAPDGSTFGAWTLDAAGGLAGDVEGTLALLDAMQAALPVADAAGMPAAFDPQYGLSDSPARGSGTGFFVDAHTLVTAEHVVAACARVALADGTELSRLAGDADLDVAAFHSPRASAAWFPIGADRAARLGQRIHAAGFPYYSIVGTALHLTGGNVSALAGVDDDARFLSFTAPVQPGNSGGPLIDAAGRVLGLVVSRLSEEFIVTETGSLPQNVNFALGGPDLRAFLDRSGVPYGDGGLAGFDMDAGAPDALAEAVVPILCL